MAELFSLVNYDKLPRHNLFRVDFARNMVGIQYTVHKFQENHVFID